MKFKLIFVSIIYCVFNSAWAAEPTVQASTTSGLLKMMLGLILVLGVMAGVAWLARRMLPGVRQQQSTIHVVGSAHVGTRERVVVLEIADRWLVVGVAPGQVNAIANLEKGAVEEGANVLGQLANSSSHDAKSLATSFGNILKKSASKFTEKTNG